VKLKNSRVVVFIIVPVNEEFEIIFRLAVVGNQKIFSFFQDAEKARLA
jgi:hypothetical protein